MTKKKIMTIELKRNGTIYLKIQLDECIEALFRNENVRTSNRWTQTDGTPLNFYRLGSTSDLTAEFNYDDYGQPFIHEGRVNFAILRTKGVSNGVEFQIPEAGYSQETLELAVKELRKKVADLYKKYCNKVAISASLTIDEVA